jgi:hypothetical protein
MHGVHFVAAVLVVPAMYEHVKGAGRGTRVRMAMHPVCALGALPIGRRCRLRRIGTLLGRNGHERGCAVRLIPSMFPPDAPCLTRSATRGDAVRVPRPTRQRSSARAAADEALPATTVQPAFASRSTRDQISSGEPFSSELMSISNPAPAERTMARAPSARAGTPASPVRRCRARRCAPGGNRRCAGTIRGSARGRPGTAPSPRVGVARKRPLR